MSEVGGSRTRRRSRSRSGRGLRDPRRGGEQVSLEHVVVGSTLPPAVPVMTTHSTNFAGVAALCVDLARVVDTRALPSLLDRTADILDASGIILWIADSDGRELNPIFAQGYRSSWSTGLGPSAGRRKRHCRRIQDIVASDGARRQYFRRRHRRAAGHGRRLCRRDGRGSSGTIPSGRTKSWQRRPSSPPSSPPWSARPQPARKRVPPAHRPADASSS